MKKISVIIPVYNAMTSGGGYINRCIDSVLHQKHFPIEDIEVLLINDGSKDGSFEELKKIKKNNPKIIRLINQKNMGVANTRNKAMRLVKGEYMTFLDQDDWIDEDFCETLYRVACQTKADIVASGYRRPDKNKKVVRVFRLTSDPYSRYTLSAAWAKLHRTEFIRKNYIEFFDNSYGEDLPFSIRENVEAKNYQTTDYIGYNWYSNEQSVSNLEQKKLTQDKIEDIERLLVHLCDITPQENHRYFYYFLLRTTVFYILFAGRSVSRRDFLEANRRFFRILESNNEAFSSKNICKILVPPKGEAFGVGLTVGAVVLLKELRLLSAFSFFWCKR